MRTTGRKRFTQRCLDNPSKFHDQIPKIKASTFATEELQIKRKKADGKIEILKMEHALMGRILKIALENQ